MSNPALRQRALHVARLAMWVLAVFVFGAVSHTRNGVWRNDLSLGKDAAEKSPNSARALANLAQAYASNDMMPEAIAANMRSLDIVPSAVAYNNLGLLYARAGRPDDAIAMFDRAIGLKPAAAEIYVNRGNVHFDYGRYDRAIQDFTAAVMLDPRYVQAYMNRGNALDEKGLFAAAMDDYETALAIDPAYADVYHNRGVALRKAGRLPEARADFQRACNGGHAGACRVLGLPDLGAKVQP